MIEKIKKFFSEVGGELKKVSWLTRPELVEATKVVVVSSFLLGGYIAVIDIILSRFVGLFIR